MYIKSFLQQKINSPSNSTISIIIEKKHFRSSSCTLPQDSGQHSADNLQLPLENGGLISNPQINISEEVNRTTIWKQVNNCNVLFTKKQTKKTSQKYRKNPPLKSSDNPNTNQQMLQQQQSLSESISKNMSEIDKRLSTMREEEETNSDDANNRQLNHQKRTQV